MRAASLFALVASLFIFTGCSSIGGGGCAGGGCGLGGQSQGYIGGGCDSGGCDAGGSFAGTSGNFSDTNCGPLCGADLSGVPTGSTGCSDCQLGRSYLGGNLQPGIRVQAGAQALASRFRGAVGGIGPCRGLGASVGCNGCGDCGGSAIGLNHSSTSGPFADGGGGCLGCGRSGCLGRCGLGNGSGPIRNHFASKQGRSSHPYGGEIPHTASAPGGPGGGGPGAGGTAPTYAYPYYTTRGPRDFLMSNPPSIGR